MLPPQIKEIYKECRFLNEGTYLNSKSHETDASALLKYFKDSSKLTIWVYRKKCVKKKERVRHLPGYCLWTSLESIDDDEE